MTGRGRFGRTVLGGLLALVLATAVTMPLTATDRTAGRATAVLEDVPGPEAGPPCPVDRRYVDERPDGLREDVLAAWHRLRAEAAEERVWLCLNDGKRSAAQQRREFTDAVRRFGTRELARKYVLPPEGSMHVTGIAVDVQPSASAAWVERNGRALGWCRRYENEYWHSEYAASHVADGCPELLPNP